MEGSELLPTKDTVEARFKAFVKYAVELTLDEVIKIKKVSLDGDTAKGVDANVVGEVASIAEGIPGAKGGFKFFQKGVEKASKGNEHNQAKRLHKALFEGFEENLQELRKILTEAYAEVFINQNLQFFHILQDLEDSWENAMRKLALDAKCRLFNYLKVIVANNHEKKTGYV